MAATHYLSHDAPYQTDLREPFLDTLNEVQSEFRRRGIECRVIGSLATSAYIEPPVACSLDFNRSGAHTVDQRVPDIDLVVPRHSLPEARDYRDTLARSSFPVKVGLALPTSVIDFRPEESTSYLTHGRRVEVPVSSDVFKPVQRVLLGVPITTVSARTLYHSYHLLGPARRRDRSKLERLASIMEDEPTDDADVAFQRFTNARRDNPSPVRSAVRAAEALVDLLPPVGRQKIRHYALPIASALGLR